AEKGIDIERRAVDIMREEHKTAEMSRLNPFQRVPFLVLDDGQVISESIAICRYLEELHPEPQLFGRTMVERALVEMWQRRIELELLFPIAHTFRHSHPAMAHLENPQISQWSEVNRDRAFATMALLDKELSQRPFIAGDAYSVADITALCSIDFMRVAGMRIDEDHKNLKRWHDEVSARPGSVR
ncbi:MAG TPA: glutathione S-transferase, partial [Rhizobiales bacterium]|nr:glutathione S-transferase [Hyphomicrobiales bacterium]